MPNSLKEDQDYYINKEGLFVFTATYHLKRGYCCENNCLHCPYTNKDTKKETTKPSSKS